MLKYGVRDNQGLCILKILQSPPFNMDALESMYVGKTFDITLEDYVTDAEITKIAEAVANPIIERYTITVIK